ncbi:hypothetical protein ACIHFD_34860 [Nonomuraea sp. NPDC051941]|uniref:hypothetical protein n=1 Tax=Nonomuraea sp. NPDC051941 TaxID=3364373 RepID=UPI0037CAC89C
MDDNLLNDDTATIGGNAARLWFDEMLDKDDRNFTDRYKNQLAFFNFAIALGEGRYRFDDMDDQRRSLLAAATARATAPMIGL